jgi:hypothetical protein
MGISPMHLARGTVRGVIYKLKTTTTAGGLDLRFRRKQFAAMISGFRSGARSFQPGAPVES